MLQAVLFALIGGLSADAPPAFPGAEGAGAQSLGGRGGRVVYVTTLNDAGPGSLRDACAQEGPRTVLFKTSGLIDLKSPIRVTHGRLTIAGQTAPGAGIALRGAGLYIEADDVVLRHLRIRPGDVLGEEVDGLCVSSGHRIVIDHCSVSWSVDEVLSVTGTSDAVTVQWTVISEALHRSVHKKGPHGMGSLLRSKDGTYSFHHCLYAHNNTRNPRPGDNYDGSPGVLLDFRNNLIYDWGGACGYGVDERFRMNYVGNALKFGPSTSPKERHTAFHVGGSGNAIFLEENSIEGLPEADADNRLLLGWPKDFPEASREAVLAPAAFPAPPVATSTSAEAREAVLRGVGAIRPQRDAVDARLVREVRDGTGRIIDSQNEVGGWPEYPSTEAPADRDGDGMPDAWEAEHNLNPDDADDGNADVDSDGYTNLEQYLNSLAAP